MIEQIPIVLIRLFIVIPPGPSGAPAGRTTVHRFFARNHPFGRKPLVALT